MAICVKLKGLKRGKKLDKDRVIFLPSFSLQPRVSLLLSRPPAAEQETQPRRTSP
ncbi:hypothetical protein SLEP1_g23497 [Rubroshorea leprosula]|uniref:Uncharacterized protein n=1 Tax=Rubroshorea leprosula TaxID=152421 RepID=A0AAV5JFM1_9ROSI|nr:hypothetical protein SLEP1_g23497 [Rubroshorea leprosula]